MRSDKKKEVKATLLLDLKDAIYRLGHITHTPIKDICEYMCIAVLNESQHIDELSKYFVRDLKNVGNIKFGNLENMRIKKRVEGAKERVTIKFKRADYEHISKLAYALDVSPSRAVAILLEIAMSDISIVNQYVKEYLKKELNENQMNDLKQLLRYINRNNDAHNSWASLLAHIIDEVGSPMVRLKDIIKEFLKHL